MEKMERDVKKIFNFICGSGGVISFTALMKHPSPLAKFSPEEAKRRLKEIGEKHQCFVLGKEHEEISSVKIYFKTRLCIKYIESNCEDGDKCKYWHVCKGYMEGNCGQTNCHLSHDFKDEQNLAKAQDLELNQFGSNAIRNVFFNCLPRVCIDYMTTGCTLKENCINLHLCSNLVQNLCSDANCCRFNHELNSSPNVAALRKAELSPKMPQKILFSHILLPKHGESYAKGRQQEAAVLNNEKPVESCAVTDQQQVKLNNLSKVSETDQSTSTFHIVENEFGGHKQRKKRSRRKKGKQSQTMGKLSSEGESLDINIQASDSDNETDINSAKAPTTVVISVTDLKTNKKQKELRMSLKDCESCCEETSQADRSDKHVSRITPNKSFYKSNTGRLSEPQHEQQGQYKQHSVFSPLKHQSHSVSDMSAQRYQDNFEPTSLNIDRSAIINGGDQVLSAPFSTASLSVDSAAAVQATRKTDGLLPTPVNVAPLKFIGFSNDKRGKNAGNLKCFNPVKDVQSKPGLLPTPGMDLKRPGMSFTEFERKEKGRQAEAENMMGGQQRCDFDTEREKSGERTTEIGENLGGAIGRKRTGVRGEGSGGGGREGGVRGEREGGEGKKGGRAGGVKKGGREGGRGGGRECGGRGGGRGGGGRGKREGGGRGKVGGGGGEGGEGRGRGRGGGRRGGEGGIRGGGRGRGGVGGNTVRQRARGRSTSASEVASSCSTSDVASLNDVGEEQDFIECYNPNEPLVDFSDSSQVPYSQPSILSQGSLAGDWFYASQSQHQTASQSADNFPASKPADPFELLPMPQDEATELASSKPNKLISSSRGLQTPMAEPSEKAVFQCLLKEYNGTSKFLTIASREELFPSTFRDTTSWFRARQNTFLLSENEKGEIEEVSAFCSKARLCFDSARCQKDDCRYFHMCRSHVADECRMGISCKANHDLQNPRDRRNVQRCNLDYLTDDQFRQLLRASSPQICWGYNKEGCTLKERCCKLHICKEFVRRSCDNCHLDHEEAFNTQHTKKLLARYHLERVQTRVVKRTLLICRETHPDTPVEDTSNGELAEHIHQGSRERHICVDFILGKCRQGLSCDMHHCRQPYLWQCQQPVSGNWMSLSVEESESIEESFCDCETIFCSHNLDLSSISTRFSQSEKLEVNYSRMTVGRKYETASSALKLRRLSTESHVKLPDVALATKWVWFWDSGGNTYVEYGLGDDDSMQEEIELFFLDNVDSYPFRVAEHNYNLYFSGMHQVNLDPRYKTTRDVRRRPVFRNRSEVQRLITEAGKKLKKQKQGEKENSLPASWMPMQPRCDYKRFKLPPNHAEFREVQKLFSKTALLFGKDRIVAVERVQNPFMWEKYQRKKDQMNQRCGRSAVNEKKLFHGTSPDIIDSICKQNFDWRLHGTENAAVYGQGSYFARDASYSCNYAKAEGSNSSRFMFVAKVLVGSYTKGSKEMRRPPPRSPSDPSDLYDSCVDDVSDPSIFVVFDNDQYYPSHVIEFTGVPIRVPTASSNPGYGGHTTSSSGLRPSSNPGYTTNRSGVRASSNPGYGGYTSSSSGVRTNSNPGYGGYTASSSGVRASSNPQYGGYTASSSGVRTSSNPGYSGYTASNSGARTSSNPGYSGFTASSSSSSANSYDARSRSTSQTNSSSKSSKESSCSVM